HSRGVCSRESSESRRPDVSDMSPRILAKRNETFLIDSYLRGMTTSSLARRLQQGEQREQAAGRLGHVSENTRKEERNVPDRLLPSGHDNEHPRAAAAAGRAARAGGRTSRTCLREYSQRGTKRS